MLDSYKKDIIGTNTQLAYADDIILFGESKHEVEDRARKLIKSSSGTNSKREQDQNI